MLRVMAYLALATLVVGVSLHAAAEPTYACSCVPPDPPRQALSKADNVFAGEVVELSDTSLGVPLSSTDPILIEFRVSSVWKGQPYETMFVTTARSEASCGFTFRLRQRYMVYARDGEASLCSRTKHVAHADDDLAALGEGNPPPPGTSQPKPGLSLDTPLGSLAGYQVYILAGLLGFGLTAALVWLARRRRASK